MPRYPKQDAGLSSCWSNYGQPVAIGIDLFKIQIEEINHSGLIKGRPLVIGQDPGRMKIRPLILLREWLVEILSAP